MKRMLMAAMVTCVPTVAAQKPPAIRQIGRLDHVTTDSLDAWAVMSDGSLAVVRERDYHIDWLGTDGRRTSSPKMAFEWTRLDDAPKLALLDSSAKEEQQTIERQSGRGAAQPAGTVVADSGGADRGCSSSADAENNLWIRTSTVVDGRPVYDVVNRRGELFDRVQLPAFRTIAGFGSGVIYMAVREPPGAVHLERARVR